jgi:hypothetical protein
LLLWLAAGCAAPASNPSATQKDSASWYQPYLLKSPSVIAAKAQINNAGYRMAVREEEVTAEDAYITIGVNTDLRFDNYLTLRIRRSGEVLVMDLTGEYVPDRPKLYPFTP